MTHLDRETMQRAIGILEGIMLLSDNSVANALDAAVNMLNEVLGSGIEVRK